MTQFAEKLPPEWQSKWEGMRESSKCDQKGLEGRPEIFPIEGFANPT